eukprot:725435_1
MKKQLVSIVLKNDVVYQRFPFRIIYQKRYCNISKSKAVQLKELDDELKELHESSRDIALQNTKILNRSMLSNTSKHQTKNTKHYDGIYKLKISKCLSSRQLFAVLDEIEKAPDMQRRNFDKYLISMAMDKLIQFNDFYACQELYELILKKNKTNAYHDTDNINYVTLSMLYVCTQFVNKYSTASSLFEDEILAHADRYSHSELNKAYAYMISSSIINNQYESGGSILSSYFAHCFAFDTVVLNAMLNFYLRFDECDKLISTFNQYRTFRDVYSYIIVINYYLKMDDAHNMWKYIQLYIENEMISAHFRRKSIREQSELYFTHIRLKIPKAITIAIASYYAKHNKLHHLLFVLQCLLEKHNIFHKHVSNEVDIFMDKQMVYDDAEDVFCNQFIRFMDEKRFFKKQRPMDDGDGNDVTTLSFVYEPHAPCSRVYLAVLKCIGNRVEMNNVDRWHLIDFIVSKMKKSKVDYDNNIFYGLFISLCNDDLDKAMRFYHKMIAIAQKKRKDSMVRSATMMRNANDIFLVDFDECDGLYQVNAIDTTKKNVHQINLFKPTHRELFNLLNVGIKHHANDHRRKELFCLWWINELKRLKVQPTRTAVQLITEQCQIE